MNSVQIVARFRRKCSRAPSSARSRRFDGRTRTAMESAAVKTASSKSKPLERTLAPEIELLWETASLAPMPQE